VSLIVIPFCLSVCLSVILRPTAYHDWSITTKFGPRTRVTCKPFWIPYLPYFRCQREKYAKFRLFPSEYDASCHMTCSLWILSSLNRSQCIPSVLDSPEQQTGEWLVYRNSLQSPIVYFSHGTHAKYIECTFHFSESSKAHGQTSSNVLCMKVKLLKFTKITDFTELGVFHGRRPISRKMSWPWNRELCWSLMI